jgi:hypothetical protein
MPINVYGRQIEQPRGIPSRGLEPCIRVLFASKHNHRSLSFTLEKIAPNQVSDTDMKKAKALKKATSEGTCTSQRKT